VISKQYGGLVLDRADFSAQPITLQQLRRRRSTNHSTLCGGAAMTINPFFGGRDDRRAISSYAFAIKSVLYHMLREAPSALQGASHAALGVLAVTAYHLGKLQPMPSRAPAVHSAPSPEAKAREAEAPVGGPVEVVVVVPVFASNPQQVVQLHNTVHSLLHQTTSCGLTPRVVVRAYPPAYRGPVPTADASTPQPLKRWPIPRWDMR
jgi:hypothetical protein